MIDNVKIFTTESCYHCKAAKNYLSDKGVNFTSYNIANDMDALKEMIEITGGARSVPVISVGKKVVIGFDRDKLEQALSVQ